MFATIQTDLLMVNNFTNSYSPVYSDPPEQPWDSYSGYFIKLNQPKQFQICGQELSNKTVSLSVGWNLLPVLSDCVYFCEEILFGLDYEFIQASAGLDIYWPSRGIQTLYFFEPGKSYLIKMNSAGSVTFPACD
jgi:hypothetical protein